MLCVGVIVVWCFQQPTPVSNVATFCGTARPIRMSHRDTRGTKEQVDMLNRDGARICGWK